MTDIYLVSANRGLQYLNNHYFFVTLSEAIDYQLSHTEKNFNKSFDRDSMEIEEKKNFFDVSVCYIDGIYSFRVFKLIQYE